MRISTNQMYQDGVHSLMTQQERLNKLQVLVGNNFIKVESAADDPISYAQIESLSLRVEATDILQRNCKNSANALNLEESVLADCISSLQGLREIQMRSGNAGLSQAERQIMATEVNEILTRMLAFGNTVDNNGNYMFSGGQASTMPFTLDASGQYIYSGDSTQRFQLIGNSLQVPVNDPGDGVFMRIPNGNGNFSISQTATPNTGTCSVSTGSVVDSSTYVPDSYTVNFELNSSGNLVVMVSGAASGFVIPTTGAVDDAPVYQEGMSLNFNGMTLQLSGMPNPGDAFVTSLSENQSIFATMQQMITNLNLPYGTATEKAATGTTNNQLLAEIDSAMQVFSTTISTVGTRLNQVAYAYESNEDFIMASNIILKSLREADPIAAAEDLNQQIINLQAAQQSFVRIRGLSVFNYI